MSKVLLACRHLPPIGMHEWIWHWMQEKWTERKALAERITGPLTPYAEGLRKEQFAVYGGLYVHQAAAEDFKVSKNWRFTVTYNVHIECDRDEGCNSLTCTCSYDGEINVFCNHCSTYCTVAAVATDTSNFAILERGATHIFNDASFFTTLRECHIGISTNKKCLGTYSYCLDVVSLCFKRQS